MKQFLFLAVFLYLVAIAGQGQENPSNKAELSIPGVTGVLQIDVGPTRFETRVRPDGKETQMRAFGRPDHLGISAFLQRVTFPASAEKCRAEWWPATKKSAKLRRDDLQETLMKDGIARVEFIIPEFQGVKVRQKTVHAYLGERDLCAEVHLSKVDFQPSDQMLFEQVLASVKLLASQAASNPQTAPEEEVMQYFREGSQAYMRQDYKAAAVPYQKALDLEKKNHTLSHDYFRVLVDNLGMSYGISGKLDQAKAVFEYGLTQDAEYPLFYYNLACTYGEQQKMSEAIEQLRLAYKYKENMIPGETFPDPMKDDSFRYFVNKEEFVKAVRDMQK